MSFSNRKIPFGIKNGVLVDVLSVCSGLACECFCPSCLRPLQANKGDKVSHYFSHDPSIDSKNCVFAAETAIHLMAKQIISEEGYIVFPELVLKATKKDLNGKEHEEICTVDEQASIAFDRIELEKFLGDIRPDILAYSGNIPYLIEVAVTHNVDIHKKKKIRSRKIYAIEISLSGLNYNMTKDELRERIIEDIANKKWLSNPKAPSFKRDLINKLREKVERINNEIRNRFYSNSRVKKLVKYANSNPSVASKGEVREEYNLKWFFCESCRSTFKKPKESVPLEKATIPCPSCGFLVSTIPISFK